MYKLQKASIILCVFMVASFCLCTLLLIDNPIFETVYINGVKFYKFNLSQYLYNISISFDSFGVSFDSITDFVLNFDNVISGLKSIINCLIFIANLILLPISLTGSLSAFIYSLFCLPLNSSNFLYLISIQLTALQIPYIPY